MARTFTLSDFDFALPPQLIAQHPAPERTASRLLDGRADAPVDRIFKDLPSLLRAGDLLVFNDTKVVNARLWGNKPAPPRAAKAAPPPGGQADLGRPGVALPTGGKAELLIERVLGGEEVAAHVRVSKKPPVGTTLKLVSAPGHEDGFSATLLGRWPDADGPLFRFRLFNNTGDSPYTLMERHGQIPLPPYIERPQGGASNPDEAAEDLERYQTVFAKNPGAVAAPTAALHFDDGLFAQLDAMGVARAFVTLHVGAGTFQPVKTENLAEHRMHSEWYAVPQATQDAIAACRARGGRVVAVGTTSVRTLESWAKSGAATGDTNIFITPGFAFQVVDVLITNFHLPKSTLMMLVSAFAGYEPIMALYRHAIAQGYRFFSYGDAMLLERRTQPNTTAP